MHDGLAGDRDRPDGGRGAVGADGDVRVLDVPGARQVAKAPQPPPSGRVLACTIPLAPTSCHTAVRLPAASAATAGSRASKLTSESVSGKLQPASPWLDTRTARWPPTTCSQTTLTRPDASTAGRGLSARPTADTYSGVAGHEPPGGLVAERICQLATLSDWRHTTVVDPSGATTRSPHASEESTLPAPVERITASLHAPPRGRVAAFSSSVTPTMARHTTVLVPSAPSTTCGSLA